MGPRHQRSIPEDWSSSFREEKAVVPDVQIPFEIISLGVLVFWTALLPNYQSLMGVLQP